MPLPSAEASGSHLCIVLTKPFQDRLLIVNLTRAYGQSVDDTCIIVAGHNRFITKESFVFYKKAFIKDVRAIFQGLENRKIEKRGLLDNSALNRVCNGITESLHTSFEVKKFYQEYLESLND